MRRLLQVVGGAAVVAAAVYVFVYLYRWEWQRALFTAALLLVAEVALLGGLLLERIARVEARLAGTPPPSGAYLDPHAPTPRPGGAASTDRLPAAPRPGGAVPATGLPAGPRPSADGLLTVSWDPGAPSGNGDQGRGTLEHLRATAPPPRVTFQWLRPGGDQTSVFVPVLLGAGIVVSGLAWLVERVAHATARPVMERGLADRLTPLTMPAGGPLDGGADVADPAPRRPTGPRALAAVLLTVAVAAAGVLWLAEHTQDRPDPPSGALVSTLVVEVASIKNSPGDLTAQVTQHWELCRETTRLDLDASGLVSLGADRFAIVVEPGLGENAAKRLRGCLQDATIDHAQLTVLTISDARR